MMSKKMWKLATALMMVIMMAGAMALLAGCGSADEGGTAEDETTVEETEATEATEAEAEVDPVTGLTAEDEASLMKQIAEKEQEKLYSDEVSSEIFANAEFFGADKEGENVTAYGLINTSQYVAVKGKAYLIAGSQGEAIVKYTEGEGGPKLQEVIWSADGTDHDKWLEENFPKEYLDKDKAFKAYDDNGKSVLEARLAEEVEEKMGVPVEEENIIEIEEEDDGSYKYKIIKTTQSGSPENGDYEFDSETLEEGNLEDLQK